MDETRFDALLKSVNRFTSRRAALKTAGVGGLAAVMGGLGRDAEAKKKKKKCKKPKVKCGKKCCAAGSVCVKGKCAAGCRFAKSDGDTRWTLQGDCTTTRTIEIPNGVTLDGDGKTITLAGPAAGFADPITGFRTGILAQSGQASIQSLAIRGTGLEGDCFVTGLFMDETAGTITDVSVSDVCAPAISVRGGGGQLVSLTRVSVARVASFDGSQIPGIQVFGDANTSGVRVEIDDADVTGVSGNGFHLAGAEGAITNSTVQNAASGIWVDGRCDLDVDSNQIEGVAFGVAVTFGSTVAVTNNTIVGLGPSEAELFSTGVGFGVDAAGAITGNAISNFFNPDAEGVGCGIFIGATAGNVTIGSNTFPNPPGNEQDICDNRP